MINLSVNIKSENKSYPIFIENQTITALKEQILTFLKTLRKRFGL